MLTATIQDRLAAHPEQTVRRYLEDLYAAKERCGGDANVVLPETDIMVDAGQVVTWGRFCEEWTLDEANEFRAAVNTLISTAKSAREWDAWDTNAWPIIADGIPSRGQRLNAIDDLIDATENLLYLYARAVSSAKEVSPIAPPRRPTAKAGFPWGWVAVGLGVAGVVGYWLHRRQES